MFLVQENLFKTMHGSLHQPLSFKERRRKPLVKTLCSQVQLCVSYWNNH